MSRIWGHVPFTKRDRAKREALSTLPRRTVTASKPVAVAWFPPPPPTLPRQLYPTSMPHQREPLLRRGEREGTLESSEWVAGLFPGFMCELDRDRGVYIYTPVQDGAQAALTEIQRRG